MKAAKCMECKFFSMTSLDNVCKKGHKPRFYLSKELAESDEPVLGEWKRRCNDFSQKSFVSASDVFLYDALNTKVR